MLQECLEQRHEAGRSGHRGAACHPGSGGCADRLPGQSLGAAVPGRCGGVPPKLFVSSPWGPNGSHGGERGVLSSPHPHPGTPRRCCVCVCARARVSLCVCVQWKNPKTTPLPFSPQQHTPWISGLAPRKRTRPPSGSRFPQLRVPSHPPPAPNPDPK